MLKRALLIAVTAVAAQSGVALADNNWAFDDPYWKSPIASGMATSYASGAGDHIANATFEKYKQVDGYNY
jgi:hypothetical protein